MRFIIIVAMHNMAPWAAATVRSLMAQSHDDFRCLIGDDVSTDGGPDIVADLIKDDPRFQLVRHAERTFSMGNIHALIEKARPDPEDVIVLVDGDDRLAHPGVLQHLESVYEAHDCWMTYGSYENEDGIRASVCQPYPAEVVRLNQFRAVAWRADHLKTFKYALWRRIPPSMFVITRGEMEEARRRARRDGRWRYWWYWRRIALENLMNPAGQFPRRCSDKNLTIPMLELAGQRIHFIEDILYIYTVTDRKHDFGRQAVANRWYQRLIRDILWHKPMLEPLTATELFGER